MSIFSGKFFCFELWDSLLSIKFSKLMLKEIKFCFLLIKSYLLFPLLCCVILYGFLVFFLYCLFFLHKFLYIWSFIFLLLVLRCLLILCLLTFLRSFLILALVLLTLLVWLLLRWLFLLLLISFTPFACFLYWRTFLISKFVIFWFLRFSFSITSF